MFEIGFSELLLLAVISVVVIGPKRLPELVRAFVVLKHKIMNMFNNTNETIRRELELDKIEQDIYNSEVSKHIEQMNQSIMNASSDANKIFTAADAVEFSDTGIEKSKNNTEKES